MAGTITWRNVTGQSLADAAKPFEYASDAFNDAIAGLKDVVTDRQEANQRVVDNRRFEERLGYQEALRGANSPEDLLARRAQLEAQFAGMDPKNRAQLMSAMNDRELALRESAIASNQYADQTEERASRDAIAQIRAGILRGEDMSGQIGALGNRFQADLLEKADAYSQEQVNRDRASTRFDREGDIHESTLATQAVNRNLANAQAGAAGEQSRLARQQMDALNAQIKANDAENSRLSQMNTLERGLSFYSANEKPETNTNEFIKTLGDRGLNADQQDNIRAKLGDSMHYTFTDSKGKSQKIPVPLHILNAALNTASSGSGTIFQWDSTVANNFKTNVDNLMQANLPAIADDLALKQALDNLRFQTLANQKVSP